MPRLEFHFATWVAWLLLGGWSLCTFDLALGLFQSSSHFGFPFTYGSSLRSYLYTLTWTLLTPRGVFLLSEYFFVLIKICYGTQDKKQGGGAGIFANRGHSFLDAFSLSSKIGVLLAGWSPKADGYSVFCALKWQVWVPGEGTGTSLVAQW